MELFKTDFYRMTGKKYCGNISDILYIITHHNVKFMWWYRKKEQPVWKLFSKIRLYFLSRKFGLEFGNASIGKGFYIGHPYNVTICDNAIIGNNVNIHKGATIGAENRGKRKGTPLIGNNVYIGINSTIVGNVSIGDDVLIAPNTFVNFNVPDHSLVIGNPAKVIRKDNATAGYIGFCV